MFSVHHLWVFVHMDILRASIFNLLCTLICWEHQVFVQSDFFCWDHHFWTILNCDFKRASIFVFFGIWCVENIQFVCNQIVIFGDQHVWFLMYKDVSRATIVNCHGVQSVENIHIFRTAFYLWDHHLGPFMYLNFWRAPIFDYFGLWRVENIQFVFHLILIFWQEHRCIYLYLGICVCQSTISLLVRFVSTGILWAIFCSILFNFVQFSDLQVCKKVTNRGGGKGTLGTRLSMSSKQCMSRLWNEMPFWQCAFGKQPSTTS